MAKSILKLKVSRKHIDELFGDVKEHEEDLLLYANRRQGLPTLCETSWLSQLDSLSTLLVKYYQVKNALHDIAIESTGQSRSDACSYLKMSEFSFIMVAVMIQHVLAFVRPLSVALQSKQYDLVEAYENCQTLITTVKDERKELNFNRLFSIAFTQLRTPMKKIKGQRFLGLQQAKGMLIGRRHQPQL